MCALLLGSAGADEDQTEPDAGLLEFLGSWQQPQDASAAELVEMMDVWVNGLATGSNDDE